MLMEYHKECPQCETAFEAKRLNQVYCSIKCKTRFNNSKARALETEQTIVSKKDNNYIWYNREILKNYRDETVLLDTILEDGFQLNYISRFEGVKQKGKQVNLLYCYDFGYQFIDPKTIKVFKNE